MLDPTPFRALFPITERYIHLNHAGVSPLNSRSVAAMAEFNQLAASQPFTPQSGLFQVLMRLKQRIARLINASALEEIALQPNTASGVNTAALSIPFRPGDNVLVLDGDYPANVYPWMNLARRGVLTKWVPARHGGLDLDLLQARIDSRTRAIALSTVQFSTGHRNDLVAVGQICRERGIWFSVDCIQSLGALPFDVQAIGADFVSCGSQKWLLGPVGAGFLYVRRERLDELVPGPYVGAASVVDFMNFLDYNFTLQPSADRFAIGSQNFCGYYGMEASLGLIEEAGIEAVGERVLHLAGVAITSAQSHGLTICGPTAAELRSGIVIIEVDDPVAACARLLEAGVAAAPRGRGVRFAAHFYNTEDEVRRAVGLLAAG